MKRLVCRTLFAALSVTILSLALAFSGCTEKKDPVGPPDSPPCVGDTCDPVTPPPSGQRVLDPRLIAAGFAWVGTGDLFGIPLNLAVVFNPDSVVNQYMGLLGIWDLEDYLAGIWYTVGNKLYISYYDEEDEEEVVDVSTYSVSGNTLTVIDSDGDTTVMQKTAWPPVVADIDGEYDPKLVNTGWMLMTDNGMEQWVFSYEEGNPLGVATYLTVDAAGMDYDIYMWRTSEGVLYISDGTSAEDSYPYVINGDELTFGGKTYTQVDIGDDDDDDDDWDWEFAPKSAKQLLKAKLPKSLGKKLSLLK